MEVLMTFFRLLPPLRSFCFSVSESKLHDMDSLCVFFTFLYFSLKIATEPFYKRFLRRLIHRISQPQYDFATFPTEVAQHYKDQSAIEKLFFHELREHKEEKNILMAATRLLRLQLIQSLVFSTLLSLSFLKH